MVHLSYEVAEVTLVFDLWVFEESIVQGSHQDKYLAPVDMAWIPDLLHALLALLILQLLRNIQVLLVETCHNIGLEESLEDLHLA